MNNGTTPSNVSSAYEILLEEVEAEIDLVTRVGSKSFESRDYDKAKEALGRSVNVTNFRDRVALLRKEWDEVFVVSEATEDEETKAERTNLGRLKRGLRTTESNFYRPILQVLQEMGGSGKAATVLNRVLEVVKPSLKEVDFEPLASGPDNPRWRNTAQWARNSLVNDGLLKSDSSRGIWEISEKGVAAFKSMK